RADEDILSSRSHRRPHRDRADLDRGPPAARPERSRSETSAGRRQRFADRRPLYPLIPGGARQRELALRSGVNLVMYTLTGNYKADQVHSKDILERLTR